MSALLNYLGSAMSSVMGMLIHSSQIVRVYPRSPARLRILTTAAPNGVEEEGPGSEDESDDVKGGIGLSQWVDENVPSLHGTFTPTWWLPK